MNGLWMALGIVGLFFLRIGVPLLVLIGLGIALDRWQGRRAKMYPPPEPPREDRKQRANTYPHPLQHINDHSRP